MSSVERERPAELVAGYLAAASIFLSLTGIAYRPLRLVPVALLLAFFAAAIGGRSARLAAVAAAVGTLSFTVGLALAVATKNPLF
jgi:hypothetical protein